MVRFVYEGKTNHITAWDRNSSDLCCWHDTEPFEGPVYSYPLRKENDHWVVQGVFCSLSCVKRYILDSSYTNQNSLVLFALMCAEVYGLVENVLPAPPSHLLCKFTPNGMALEKFRGVSSTHSVAINPPHTLPFVMGDQLIYTSSEDGKNDHVYTEDDTGDPVVFEVEYDSEKREIQEKLEVNARGMMFPSRNINMLDSFLGKNKP